MLSTNSDRQLQSKHSGYTAATVGQPKIMLFDLVVGGHHGSYIQHLVEYWLDREQTAELSLVVSPDFCSIHADVCQLIFEAETDNIDLVTISPEELAQLNGGSKLDRHLRGIREWDLLCKYAKSLEIDHCLIMYFDTSWLPLILGKKAPCSFSGIYFRPTLHYRHFANYSPQWQSKFSQWREKFTWMRMVQHPQLENILCLDPFAVEHLQSSSQQVNLVHLPDPVEIYDNCDLSTAELKSKMGIENDRLVFLLFGALTERKGVNQVLDAIALLPSEVSQKVSLLLAGPISQGFKPQVEAKIALVSQSHPVQIIVRDEFLSEGDIQPYFQVADIILAPYQKHIGMSAITVRAAAAQKPLICSDFGLMGEVVREHQLGLTVDSSNPQAIADGMKECLSKSPNELGDRQKMLDFATQNSVSNFARTIAEHLIGS